MSKAWQQWMCWAMWLSAGAALASEPDWKRLYEEQKKRTDILERRLAILEEKLAAEPYVAKEKLPESTLGFLQQTELGGYVAASYFYNFNKPARDPDLGYAPNTGRGFDVRHNQFMANKLVLNLRQPVEYDAFVWKAGYAVELILGQDAEFTQASGLSLGDHGDLFQAYVELNVPLGHGLKVAFGKMVTPIGYELAETEQNPNWSAGNQWVFLEPFTHTGLSFSYAFSPQWECQLMINNGWDNVSDNNHARSFVGRLSWTPREQTSYTLVGYGGPEQDDNSSNWRRGVSFVASTRFTPKWTTAIQLDYGAESNADNNGGTAEWWGAGLWLIYEFCPKWTAAFRADGVADKDGARTSDAPALAPLPANDGMNLVSLTLTLNFKPVENLRLAPEIRWDHSSLDDAFDGHADQLTVGMGAAYQF